MKSAFDSPFFPPLIRYPLVRRLLTRVSGRDPYHTVTHVLVTCLRLIAVIGCAHDYCYSPCAL